LTTILEKFPTVGPPSECYNFQWEWLKLYASLRRCELDYITWLSCWLPPLSWKIHQDGCPLFTVINTHLRYLDTFYLKFNHLTISETWRAVKFMEFTQNVFTTYRMRLEARDCSIY